MDFIANNKIVIGYAWINMFHIWVHMYLKIHNILNLFVLFIRALDDIYVIKYFKKIQREFVENWKKPYRWKLSYND